MAAISAGFGNAQVLAALAPMDRLYPQGDDLGAVRQQLVRQLARPRPYDLAAIEPNLGEYKGIVEPWRDWTAVVAQCRHVSVLMGEAVAKRRGGWTDVRVAG